MGEGAHEDLRRLAVWLARRREVDEVLEVLTQYGPTANERVAGHLEALEALLDGEREAFRRYAEGAPQLAQRPLPVMMPEEDTEAPTNVHSLRAKRMSPGS